MATTTQPNTKLKPAPRPVDWGRWQFGLLAAAVAALGVALLAYELGLLPAAWAQVVGVGGPALLMATGAVLALRGWPAGPRALPPFAVERGGAHCAELLAETGGHDLAVRAYAGAMQLAVGEFPNPRGPRVTTQGTSARLALRPGMALPHLAGAPWSVALARGVPWDLNLRAGAGRLSLDLRDLNVASLTAQSAYGQVDLTLPAHGAAELKLRLALGDLAVSVPEGVEAKVRLVLGPLARVHVDERRFIRVAPNEWMTPLYPATARRCTVVADLWAGDLRLA